MPHNGLDIKGLIFKCNSRNTTANPLEQKQIPALETPAQKTSYSNILAQERVRFTLMKCIKSEKLYNEPCKKTATAFSQIEQPVANDQIIVALNHNTLAEQFIKTC